MISTPMDAEEARLACSPSLFRAQLSFLKENNYNFFSLSEAVNWIERKLPIPERSIIVTLDDGYLDNYKNAFPILSDLKVPATIFLVSDYMGKTNEWMARSSPNSNKTLLSWHQIHEMKKQGISFGGHTKHHVRLTDIDEETAFNEITECKQNIEDRLGEAIDFFAYPYGLFNTFHANVVKEAGYIAACSTNSGFNGPSTDIFKLRRLDIQGNDHKGRFKRKVEFGTNDGSINTAIRYYANRILRI